MQLLAYGREIAGKVLKCDNSKRVMEYQIEYTWADDGKSYLEWCCSEDLEPDDPLVAVEAHVDSPVQLALVPEDPEQEAEPAKLTVVQKTCEEEEAAVKMEFDDNEYRKFRRHYCEVWTESDAPVLGNSGTTLRHKRKRRPRIEANSLGWKRLRKELGELDRAGNDAEAYRLLHMSHQWEVRQCLRGCRCLEHYVTQPMRLQRSLT